MQPVVLMAPGTRIQAFWCLLQLSGDVSGHLAFCSFSAKEGLLVVTPRVKQYLVALYLSGFCPVLAESLQFFPLGFSELLQNVRAKPAPTESQAKARPKSLFLWDVTRRGPSLKVGERVKI